MRVLCMCSLVLLACRTHTLPITSMPAYAANQPVVTAEGYGISLADGGAARLVPRDDDGCLVKVGATTPDVATVGLVPETLPCRNVVLQGVTRVEAGPLLRIQGQRGVLEVDPQLVESVEIVRPRQGAAPYAMRTGVHSPEMIGVGSTLLAGGIAAAIACFFATAELDDQEDPWGLTRFGLAFLGANSLAGGLGGGLPLIVLGARSTRLPVTEQAPLQQAGLQFGGALGLRWTFE